VSLKKKSHIEIETEKRKRSYLGSHPRTEPFQRKIARRGFKFLQLFLLMFCVEHVDYQTSPAPSTEDGSENRPFCI